MSYFVLDTRTAVDDWQRGAEVGDDTGKINQDNQERTAKLARNGIIRRGVVGKVDDHLVESIPNRTRVCHNVRAFFLALMSEWMKVWGY